MPVIKRYSNRKLYNTTSKHYISLDDIAELVRSGQEVRIFDHDSGSDITTLVLFQVILEEEKRIGGLLPEIILTRIIRSGKETLEHIRKIVSRPLQDSILASDMDLEIERRIEDLIFSEKISPEEGARMLALLMEKPGEYTETEPAHAATCQPNDDISLIHQLLAQVDRLEAEVEELRR